MQEPNVLVTGSSGHLGTALMLSLPSYGYTPIGLDILPSPTTTHLGSITNRTLLASLFAAHPKIAYILHTATLHKPHITSHSQSDFIDVNISGTLALLETSAAALGERIKGFIFLSTTSTFGHALSVQPGEKAVWIDEDVVPLPKNIYGVTKLAAENLCRLIHLQTRMPVVVLRTSRFFPEPDDDAERRAALGEDNLKVLELAYRRVELEDVVSACVRAMERAVGLGGWRVFVVSAPPPFQSEDEGVLERLGRDAEAVFEECVPGIRGVFEGRGWGFLKGVDRVYDSRRAVRELGWVPRFTVEEAVRRVASGEEWRSAVAVEVGRKGYHEVSTGVYTVR